MNVLMLSWDFTCLPNEESIRSLLGSHDHVELMSNVSTLPVALLSKCNELKTIDFRGLSNVT